MISFELTGLGELIMGLKSFQKDLGDLKPELTAAAKRQTEHTKKLFMEGGDPPWEDIAYVTRKQRKANKTGLPMTEHGDLLRSVTALREGVAGSAFSYKDDVLTIGSTEKRAPALQQSKRMMKLRDEDGKWTGQMKPMPSRPFLYFTDTSVNDARQGVIESVEQRMRRRLGL